MAIAEEYLARRARPRSDHRHDRGIAMKTCARIIHSRPARPGGGAGLPRLARRRPAATRAALVAAGQRHAGRGELSGKLTHVRLRGRPRAGGDRRLREGQPRPQDREGGVQHQRRGRRQDAGRFQRRRRQRLRRGDAADGQARPPAAARHEQDHRLGRASCRRCRPSTAWSSTARSTWCPPRAAPPASSTTPRRCPRASRRGRRCSRTRASRGGSRSRTRRRP